MYGEKRHILSEENEVAFSIFRCTKISGKKTRSKVRLSLHILSNTQTLIRSYWESFESY